MQKLNITSLQEEYQKHLQKELPQRAKGIAYEHVIAVGLVLAFFCGLLLVFSPIKIYNNFFVGLLSTVFLYFIFFGLPFYFYDNNKRTKRWAKRHYPKVYTQIYQFKEKDKQDRMITAPFLLHIEGHKLFIGPYGRQGLRDTKAVLTGTLLMDENTNLISDKDLFRKAFLTYSYGSIGNVDYSRKFINQGRVFLDEWKIYVPRAQKFLNRQRKYLEENGYGSEWERVDKLLPSLLEAGKDSLSLYEERARFRKSIGYSFANEFWYEDALKEYDMRQAFVQYMKSAYITTINQIRQHTSFILAHIEQDGTGLQKKTITKAIKKIWCFAVEIQLLIERMEQYGIPSEENIKQFESKTAYAKNLLLSKSK